MNTHYLHLFFGELRPYQINAASEKEAEAIAIEHTRKEVCSNMSDKEEEFFIKTIVVNFYRGSKPWHNELENHFGWLEDEAIIIS